MRILAVDHGEKRIGVAISDETATIASPVKVVEHISRAIDAAQIADIAAQNNAGLIVGAIVGGAIASQHGYYGPGYYGPSYYAPGPAYVEEPGYGPECYLQKQRFWDGYGWRVRNVRICD